MYYSLSTSRIFQLLWIVLLNIFSSHADYRVGIGIADITGPVAEIAFSGYGSPLQKGEGLHLRQYARAFVIVQEEQRVAFVTIDGHSIGYGLRKQVLSSLNKTYGSLYNGQNVVLSAIHTHSVPGGFAMDLLYDFPTLGFVQQTFDALHDGIVQAVLKAHDSIQNAKIFINSGTVLDVNVNRSPLAYLLNPEVERDEYMYDVDKELIQLKFIASPSNALLGVLHWFPVHPTSLNITNTLVSSDNVGYASILLEEYFNKDALIGQGPFIAGFASSNLGDVSPNIKGPRCIDTGLECDKLTSTCCNRSQQCIAFGPGHNMFESAKIIAERLFKKGLELLENNSGREINGPILFRHQYADMSRKAFEYVYPNQTVVENEGCLPAMGYSFAAGTTDGPGILNFKQGTLNENSIWNFLRNILAEPTKLDISCHYPKPILLFTGKMQTPYRWQPQIVSTQIVVIGDVVIAAVPGEFTTMAGRRLKKIIKAAFLKHNQSQHIEVIIAGLSNTYSSYITTPEEYQLQRYEGASTIYGQHTLTIYQDIYSTLVEEMINNEELNEGIEPKDISNELWSLTLPVLYDLPVWGYRFGDCRIQPPTTAKRGTTITAVFIAGNPRNNLMHNKTFLTVENLVDNEWIVIATDANWETKFIWKNTHWILGHSEATIEWYIKEDIRTGEYRISHFGHYKSLNGNITPYNGSTHSFNVV